MHRSIYFCLMTIFATSVVFAVPTLPDVPQESLVLNSSFFGSGRALTAYEKGYAYYKTGEFEKSEDCLKEALHYEPNLLKAHYWLGKLYNEMGRLDDAVFHFEEVKRLEKLIKERRIALTIKDNEYPAGPKIPVALKTIKEARAAYERGLTLLDGGHWDGAIVELKKAQSLYPSNHKYLLKLARTLYDRGDIQASVGYYRELMLLRDVSYEHFMEGTKLMFEAGMDYIVAPLAKKQEKRFSSFHDFKELIEKFKPEIDTKINAMGQVVKRMNGQVIINIGFEEGLKLSDEYSLTLQAFRPGEKLVNPDNGKAIGREPNKALAELLITKVYKNSSWALIRREYNPGVNVKVGDLIEFKKADR